VAAGRHAEALVLLPPAALAPEQEAVQVQMHALAARCHVQLGCLREAAADYTAAIHLATAGQQKAQLCELLLARATLYEQLEQPQAALADVMEAGRLQQPLPATALLAADRLKRACERAK
jgi:tetratricopeptide (TPR) repeat protein